MPCEASTGMTHSACCHHNHVPENGSVGQADHRCATACAAELGCSASCSCILDDDLAVTMVDCVHYQVHPHLFRVGEVLVAPFGASDWADECVFTSTSEPYGIDALREDADFPHDQIHSASEAGSEGLSLEDYDIAGGYTWHLAVEADAAAFRACWNAMLYLEVPIGVLRHDCMEMELPALHHTRWKLRRTLTSSIASWSKLLLDPDTPDHCLFEAVGALLHYANLLGYEPDELVLSLRRVACLTLKCTLPGLLKKAAEQERIPQAIYARRLMGRMWGGLPEVIALATAFECRFVIVTPAGSVVYTAGAHGPILTLGYTGRHYVALYPDVCDEFYFMSARPWSSMTTRGGMPHAFKLRSRSAVRRRQERRDKKAVQLQDEEPQKDPPPPPAGLTGAVPGTIAIAQQQPVAMPPQAPASPGALGTGQPTASREPLPRRRTAILRDIAVVEAQPYLTPTMKLSTLLRKHGTMQPEIADWYARIAAPPCGSTT